MEYLALLFLIVVIIATFRAIFQNKKVKVADGVCVTPADATESPVSALNQSETAAELKDVEAAKNAILKDLLEFSETVDGQEPEKTAMFQLASLLIRVRTIVEKHPDALD